MSLAEELSQHQNTELEALEVKLHIYYIFGIVNKFYIKRPKPTLSCLHAVRSTNLDSSLFVFA